MSKTLETIRIDHTCPNCGTAVDPNPAAAQFCPQCHFSFEDTTAPTGTLHRIPSVLWAQKPSDTARLDEDMQVVFQFLPSGSCVWHTLADPLVVGRLTAASGEFLDLNPYNADLHGVSRQHCRFWRQENHVMVMDLGSTNGTYLNTERLIPQQPYRVHHNARLILGSLHMVITFGCPPLTA